MISHSSLLWATFGLLVGYISVDEGDVSTSKSVNLAGDGNRSATFVDTAAAVGRTTTQENDFEGWEIR